MRCLLITIIVIFCSINYATAKTNITVDHPFLYAALEDLFPGEFEIAKVYSNGNLHENIGLKPSQANILKSSKYILTLVKIDNFKHIAANNAILFNPADCSALEDRYCNNDKHFWLSSDVALQIYKNIIAFAKLHELSQNVNTNNKAIQEIADINIAKMLSRCNKKIYTEHQFHLRLQSYSSLVIGSIFNHSEQAIPSVVTDLLESSGILLSESHIDAKLKRKLENSGVKIFHFDADGIEFNTMTPGKCITRYCSYINKNMNICEK